MQYCKQNVDIYQLLNGITGLKRLRIFTFNLQSKSEVPVSEFFLKNRGDKVLLCFHLAFLQPLSGVFSQK